MPRLIPVTSPGADGLTPQYDAASSYRRKQIDYEIGKYFDYDAEELPILRELYAIMVTADKLRRGLEGIASSDFDRQTQHEAECRQMRRFGMREEKLKADGYTRRKALSRKNAARRILKYNAKALPSFTE